MIERLKVKAHPGKKVGMRESKAKHLLLMEFKKKTPLSFSLY